MPLAAHASLLSGAGFDLLGSDGDLRIYNGQWGTCFSRRPG